MDTEPTLDPSLTPSQRAVAALALLPDIRRQFPVGRRAAFRSTDSLNCAHVHMMADLPKNAKTRNRLAKIAHVDHDLMAAAMRLQKEAPAKLDDVAAGRISLVAALREVDAAKRAKATEKLPVKFGIPASPVEQIENGLVWTPCKVSRRKSEIPRSA